MRSLIRHIFKHTNKRAITHARTAYRDKEDRSAGITHLRGILPEKELQNQ